MSFEEAMEAEDISAAMARVEIERHQCSWEEFTLENGQHDFYDGETILGWLGY